MQQDIGNRILNILIEEGKPVSGRGLALRCDISVNTVRKEIEEINKEAARHGFTIESRASVGHYIRISDPELATTYLSDLHYRCRRTEHLPEEYSPTVQHLLRRILCASRPVSQERLCEEIYCSRSTLQRYLEKVRTSLERFRLRLVNTRNAGLSVEGSEWNKRQCLIFLHKAYSIDPEANEPLEGDFKNTFFLANGDNSYERIRQTITDKLFEQDGFFIPIIDVPKIANYILLSASRSKYSELEDFNEEQKEAASKSREYGFASDLCDELPARFRDSMTETDVLAVTMLFLSYETDNKHLEELPVYGELLEETEEIIRILTERWNFSPEAADETFKNDCLCYLYTLNNRSLFGIYNDSEAASMVDDKDVRTIDICIDFLHSYTRKHTLVEGTYERLGMYHMFHRITEKYRPVYYAPDVLVVSRYGVQYARSIAENLRNEYGREISSVTAREFAETGKDDFLNYDLLVTDIYPKNINAAYEYQMPAIFLNPHMSVSRSRELGEYISQIRRQAEMTVITEECFRYTSLKDKEGVFRYFARELPEWIEDEEKRYRHLKENDSFSVLEKDNGVVLLPILFRNVKSKPEILVAINDSPIKWEKGRSWVFVCYARSWRSREDLILEDIVKRFVDISIEQAEMLTDRERVDPMKILYGEQDS